MDLRIPVSYSGPIFHPEFVHPEPVLDFQGLLNDMFGRLLRRASLFRANYGWGLRNLAEPDRGMEEAVYNGLPEALSKFLIVACERQEALELEPGSDDLEEMLREQLLRSLGIRPSEAQQKWAIDMSRKDFLAATELTVETGDLAAFDG